jgi:PKHD-type hydroxylase
MTLLAPRRQWSAPASHHLFRAVYSPDEAAAIVTRYGAGDKKRSLHGEEGHSSRDTDVRWIMPNQTDAAWVFERAARAAADWNALGFQFELAEPEALQLAHYGADQHYTWHVDFGPFPGYWRKLSFVAMLSPQENYEGGALQFMGETGPFAYEMGAGDAVVFPPWIKHRVTPVTKGDRWSLTTWFRGPPFR